MMLQIEKVPKTATTCQFKPREIDAAPVDGSGADIGCQADSRMHTVADFRLRSEIVFIAVAALIIASHHLIVAQLGRLIEGRAFRQNRFVDALNTQGEPLTQWQKAP